MKEATHAVATWYTDQTTSIASLANSKTESTLYAACIFLTGANLHLCIPCFRVPQLL